MVVRQATDSVAVPDRFLLRTGQAQKVLYLLEKNPFLFESAVEEELEALRQQRDHEREERRLLLGQPSGRSPAAAAAANSSHKDAVVLRRRIAEVKAADRARAVSELLYLKVVERFVRLQVPLVSPLKGGGNMAFDELDLKSLTTDVYSQDALELVRQHLFSIIGHQGPASFMPGLVATVQIALFQVGLVYAMSAIFGYNLRRLDARYQLEKLAGNLGGARGLNGEAVVFEGGGEAAESLKEYVQNFCRDDQSLTASIAAMSVEAYKALEHQVVALCGDLQVMKDKFNRALGRVQRPEEAARRLEAAIQRGDIKSVRITVEDLRRLILEAVAYGSLLSDSEKEVDTMYELTQAPSRGLNGLLGGDGAEDRFLPG